MCLLLQELTTQKGKQTRVKQAGFRSGGGCIDQIFTPSINGAWTPTEDRSFQWFRTSDQLPIQ